MAEIAVPTKHGSATRKPSSVRHPRIAPDLEFLALDWETDSIHCLPALLANNKDSNKPRLDAVLACDCIYNEKLIAPLVRTCEDLCRLADAESTDRPTICVIAQQLRSPEVFQAWLIEFMGAFRAWRVPNTLLSDGLKENSGYVVHIGVLRSSLEERHRSA